MRPEGPPLPGNGDAPAVAFDRRAVDEIAAVLGPSEASSLLSEFVLATEGRLRDLALHWASGNGEAWVRALHGLKGAAGMVGARGLAEICQDAEGRFRAGEPVDAERVRMDLLEALLATRLAIEAEQRRLGEP